MQDETEIMTARRALDFDGSSPQAGRGPPKPSTTTSSSFPLSSPVHPHTAPVGRMTRSKTAQSLAALQQWHNSGASGSGSGSATPHRQPFSDKPVVQEKTSRTATDFANASALRGTVKLSVLAPTRARQLLHLLNPTFSAPLDRRQLVGRVLTRVDPGLCMIKAMAGAQQAMVAEENDAPCEGCGKMFGVVHPRSLNKEGLQEWEGFMLRSSEAQVTKWAQKHLPKWYGDLVGQQKQQQQQQEEGDENSFYGVQAPVPPPPTSVATINTTIDTAVSLIASGLGDLSVKQAEVKGGKVKEDMVTATTTTATTTRPSSPPSVIAAAKPYFSAHDDGSIEWYYLYIERQWAKREAFHRSGQTIPPGAPPDMVAEAARYQAWLSGTGAGTGDSSAGSSKVEARRPSDGNPVPEWVREEMREEAREKHWPEPIFRPNAGEGGFGRPVLLQKSERRE